MVKDKISSFTTTVLRLSHWNTYNAHSVREEANFNGVIEHSIYFDFLDWEDTLPTTVMTRLCALW